MRLLLLSGGSRGIGLFLAKALAHRGYSVIEFSRSAPHRFSVGTDFAAPLAAHSTIEKSLASVQDSGLEDLLVVSNAATLVPIGPTCRKSAASVVDNLSINFTSPILFMSAAISRFRATPCRKVVANISAGAAHQGVFGWSLYCGAKVGMEGFIRSLSIEQQSEPHPFIPINIDPGVVDTEMHVVAGSASPSDFPAAARFSSRRAQGLLTPPSDAAAAITKLLLSASLAPGGSYDARDVKA